MEQAYQNPITESDVGLVYRNLNLSHASKAIINQYFNWQGQFLDYGGGYGLFVRLMRDAGFDFYWHDKFCENIFARGIEGDFNQPYELVTSFELVEHLVDPIAEIREILKLSDSFLFSTELLPSHSPKPGEWWYYAPHEGQHISIYSQQSLRYLAEQLECNFYSDGSSTHLLTRRSFPENLFSILKNPNTIARPSLLGRDAQRIFSLRQQGHSERSSLAIDSVHQDEQINLEQSSLTLEYKIIIDGVFFQLYKTGIARLWKSLLEVWSKEEFRNNLLVLDRDGTCPRIPGINYRSVKALNYQDIDSDRLFLEAICEEERADIFISTYYTTPINTPSVMMGYDMIPEVLNWDLRHPMWVSKQAAIAHASSYITISENTARDLEKFYPQVSGSTITPALCGVAPYFYPASQLELMTFRERFNLRKPYFLLIGPSMGYKNAELFLNGLDQLVSRQGFDVVCTGGSAPTFSAEARSLIPDVMFHALSLNDDQLRAAYSGAIALVYPSKYEGFGLPIVEAMKCNCPVITCANASLPEVGGDAVLYVGDDDANGMTNALLEVQSPNVRTQLIRLGGEQAKKFTWQNMGDTIKKCLFNQVKTLREVDNVLIQKILILIDWIQDEEVILESILKFLQIVQNVENLDSYEFVVETGEISVEDVDTFLSSGMMYFLMENEAPELAGLKVKFLSPQELDNKVIGKIVSKICLRDPNGIQLMIQQIPDFES
ncbi:MAG: glycosyltransferase [Alkalinema sp. CAN_BIN05]|nr:glycosyltransferase [Alkalinema sp. CAN_BIN05]